MFCSKCGAQISDGAKFCKKCGAPVKIHTGAGNGAGAREQSPAPSPVYHDPMEEDIRRQPYEDDRTASKSRAVQENRNRIVRSSRDSFEDDRRQDRRDNRKQGPNVLIIVLVILLILLLIGSAVFGIYVYRTLKSDASVELDLEDEKEDASDREEDKKSAQKEKDHDEETTAPATAAAMQNDTMAAAEVTAAAAETTATPVHPDAHMTVDTTPIASIPRLSITQDMVSESSYLVQSNGDHNYGYLAFDGDLKTSWQDGDLSKEGIGETLTVQLGTERQISGFYFNLGNHRSSKFYQENSRPSQIQVDLDDASYVFAFSDEQPDSVVYFDSPVPCETIVFTILDTFPGTKYNDTTIADIGVYGY